MNEYDPEHNPDPEWWLSLDESERADLAEESQREDEQLPSPRAHAAIHVIVENQIAMGDEIPVGATLHRLMREGLGRHDAVHAIGSVVSKHVYHAMRHDAIAEGDSDDPNESYYRELNELTAVAWRRPLTKR